MIVLHLALAAAPAGTRKAAGPAPGAGADRDVRGRHGRHHARDDLRRPGRAARDQARHGRPVRPPPRLSCRRWSLAPTMPLRDALRPQLRLPRARADRPLMCAGLVRTMRAAACALDAQPAARILGGDLTWPEPAERLRAWRPRGMTKERPTWPASSPGTTPSTTSPMRACRRCAQAPPRNSPHIAQALDLLACSSLAATTPSRPTARAATGWSGTLRARLSARPASSPSSR